MRFKLKEKKIEKPKKEKKSKVKKKLYYSLIENDLYIGSIKIEKSGTDFKGKDNKKMKRAIELGLVECR